LDYIMFAEATTDFLQPTGRPSMQPARLAVPRFFSANCPPDHARLDELLSMKAGRLKDWHDNVEKTAMVPSRKMGTLAGWAS
jgi:hypothetical protein